MPTTDTPLRYPGGKTQLSPFVTDLLKRNGLHQAIYCEPFAGGAGIACRLLVNGTVSEAWINDIDRSIHAFWHSVLHETEALCDLIATSVIDMSEWYKQKALQTASGASLLELGFSTLFLSRTNRSGILKGGVIGGKAQTGNYALDCRFDREALAAKVRRIALYKDQIRLTRLDARDFLQSLAKTLPAHSLINIDPPYYNAGPDLYTNHYRHADHAALAGTVMALKHHWMLTYDDTPEIRALYRSLVQYTKHLTYYAQVKRSAFELLVLSRGLVPPQSLQPDPEQSAA